MKMFTLPKVFDFNHKNHKSETTNCTEEKKQELHQSNIEENNNDLSEDKLEPKCEVHLIGAKVQAGKIIALNESNSDEQIYIRSCKGINLYINGEHCLDDRKYVIKPDDNITYDCQKIDAIREIKISTDKSNMKAYINVKYTPEYVYKLVDEPITKDLYLKSIKEKSADAPKYKTQELINALIEQNICFGVISTALAEAVEGSSAKQILVAEGLEVVEDIPSRVKLLFNENARRVINDNETVDFKEWHTEVNVQVGDPIAEIIPRIEGADGKNILGEELKRKPVRDTPLRVGKNCHIENNKVIADLSGRPTFKNQVISVFNSFEIEDVNLSTGNINFSGDVLIGRNIQEGMSVRAGHSLLVGGSVYSSDVIVNGDALIRGSVIDSKIISGDIDISLKDYIMRLEEYREHMTFLIDCIERQMNVPNENKNIGQLANSIIEKRIKDLPKLSLNIITFNLSREVKNSPLLDFIRNKILGLNILNLESISEIQYMLQLIDSEINYWNVDEGSLVNVSVKYCQNTTIKSTGNIVISGEGEYNSNLHSLHDIVFENTKGIARGGVIRAEGNLVLGKVGSPGNVETRLEVPETGKITAQVAYSNTVIKIGKQERVIDEDCKNLEAYMDKDSEIFIVKSPLNNQ